MQFKFDKSDQSLIKKGKALFKFAGKRIEKAQLKQVASSLTLTTLLSIVPALAIIMAAFSAFPLFEPYRENFEHLILGSFLPDQYSAQILGYVREFATKAASLTLFGILGLAVSAILCISTIDAALNRTFEVTQLRKLWQRLLMYWALLTLGPLLMVLSLSASTYVTRLAFIGALSEMTSILYPIAQWAVQGAALGLLYKYVPNCRVLWKDAMISGLLIALVMNVFRWGFGIYVLRGSYSTIYGAFAAIPVLLTWTYLMWMFVLAGAALTATLPILRANRYADFSRAGDSFLTAVALMKVLYLERENNQPQVSELVMAKRIGSYPDAIEKILIRLADLNYVAKVDDDKEDNWVLLADPGKATLRKVFETFCMDTENTLMTADKTSGDWVKSGLKTEWLNTPIGEVFNRKAA